MEPSRPESNTSAPTKSVRALVRALRDSLPWVQTGMNVFLLFGGHETAASVTKMITEAAARILAAISGS